MKKPSYIIMILFMILYSTSYSMEAGKRVISATYTWDFGYVLMGDMLAGKCVAHVTYEDGTAGTIDLTDTYTCSKLVCSWNNNYYQARDYCVSLGGTYNPIQ